MNSRRTILALVAVSLCTAGTFAQSTGEERPAKPPKLLWEREFGRDIIDAGIDENCFTRADRRIDRCLKWVRFYGASLGWMSPHGEMTRPPRPGLSAIGVSPNGAYLFTLRGRLDLWHLPWSKTGRDCGVYIRSLLTWDGLNRWETRIPGSYWSYPWAWVRDDGSVVEVFTGGECENYVKQIRFFDTRGDLTRMHLYTGRETSERNWAGISEHFFAIAMSFSERIHVLAFDRSGTITQSHEYPGKLVIGPAGREAFLSANGVGISDRGELAVVLDLRVGPTELHESILLVHDRGGDA